MTLALGALIFLLGLYPFSASLAATYDAILERAAREGEVIFYASMNLGEANTMIAEFEKRYPLIKVKLNRTGSEKLLAKVLTEARAKKLSADVIQTVEFSMHTFNRSGALARHFPQANSLYSKDFKEEGFWTTVTIIRMWSPIIPSWCRRAWSLKLMKTFWMPSGKARR